MNNNFKKTADDFQTALALITAPRVLHPSKQDEEDQLSLKRVLTRISKLDEGRELIETLAENNVQILFDRQYPCPGGCSASMDFENVKDGMPTILSMYVAINPIFLENGEDEMVGTLLHEMWHVKQNLNGYVAATKPTSIEDACFFKLLLEADAESFAMDATYKLMQQGDTAAMDGYRDVFAVKNVYPKVINLYPDEDVIKNGEARRTVFQFCFLNKAIREFYHKVAINQWKITETLSNNQTSKVMDMDFLTSISKLSEIDYLGNGQVDLMKEIYRKISPENQLRISQTKAEVAQINAPTVKPSKPKN